MSVGEYRAICNELAELHVEASELRAAELEARRLAYESSPGTSQSAREIDAKYAGATHQVELLKIEGDIRAHETALRYMDYEQRERAHAATQ